MDHKRQISELEREKKRVIREFENLKGQLLQKE
jgi:hypothetical protein